MNPAYVLVFAHVTIMIIRINLAHSMPVNRQKKRCLLQSFKSKGLQRVFFKKSAGPELTGPMDRTHLNQKLFPLGHIRLPANLLSQKNLRYPSRVGRLFDKILFFKNNHWRATTIQKERISNKKKLLRPRIEPIATVSQCYVIPTMLHVKTILSGLRQQIARWSNMTQWEKFLDKVCSIHRTGQLWPS